MATKDPFRKAYTQQRGNVRQRGLEMRLTFEEWKQIWLDSGRWEQRGRGADKYCMMRKGDQGHYEADNVFIGTNSQNLSEGNLGKLDSEQTKRRKSEALAGKPKPWIRGEHNPMHRSEVKAKISAAIGGGKHYAAKRVITPMGEFDSGTTAAKELGIPKPTVHWRCSHSWNGWSYADQETLAIA
jgi:hypothetical protein